MKKKSKRKIILALSALTLLMSTGCGNQKTDEVKNSLGEVNGNYVVTKTNLTIGEVIPSGVNFRKTNELAMADWKDIIGKDGKLMPFYLKHDINEKNEITASYVEFIINDEFKKQWKDEYCKDKTCEEKYDNLVNGIYAIQGGDQGLSYEKNTNTIKSAFNYEKQKDVCYDAAGEFYCEVNGLYVYTRGFGDVNVRSKDNDCRIHSDGISHCE